MGRPDFWPKPRKMQHFSTKICKIGAPQNSHSYHHPSHPPVDALLETSSLNCLFCRIPYQSPHSLNALPSFSEEALLFTDFCFVASPAPNSAGIFSDFWLFCFLYSGCRKRSSANGVRSLLFVFRTLLVTFLMFLSLFRHFFANQTPGGPGIEKIRSRPSGLKISSDRSWIEIFDRALFCTLRGPRKWKLRA